MPTIIPGYVYSLFAALIVGTIIVTSCSVATLSIRNNAQNHELTNINEYVAAQSLSLMAHTIGANQNSSQFLEMPTAIGAQRFWVSIQNDTSGAWVQSGFGVVPNVSQPKFYIPAEVNASGVFVSGSGRPMLQCCSVNQTVTLTLTSE